MKKLSFIAIVLFFTGCGLDQWFNTGNNNNNDDDTETTNSSVIIKSALTGLVLLDNYYPKTDDTITAFYTKGNGTGTEKWIWLKNDEIIDNTNKNKYTVNSSDNGKTLKARISFENQEGFVESLSTSIVIDAIIPSLIISKTFTILIKSSDKNINNISFSTSGFLNKVTIPYEETFNINYSYSNSRDNLYCFNPDVSNLPTTISYGNGIQGLLSDEDRLAISNYEKYEKYIVISFILENEVIASFSTEEYPVITTQIGDNTFQNKCYEKNEGFANMTFMPTEDWNFVYISYKSIYISDLDIEKYY